MTHEDATLAKERYLWRAKLAQETNRFEDMARYMKLTVETGAPMTRDDANMLAVAYKRVLDTKRMARRTLTAVERKDGLAPWEALAASDYRSRVDGEQLALCNEMLSVVATWFSSGRAERADQATSIFYWKLVADYKRYTAEAVVDPGQRDCAVAESRAAYEQAFRLGQHALRPIDPVRLGLMLNYSVFLYQVCHQRQQGHDLAKRAFDEALSEIDAIDRYNTYDDSTIILRLIRDNLAIWAQEIDAFDQHAAATTPTRTDANAAEQT